MSDTGAAPPETNFDVASSTSYSVERVEFVVGAPAIAFPGASDFVGYGSSTKAEDAPEYQAKNTDHTFLIS